MHQNNFDSLGIGGKFRRVLQDVGYKQPTPIQAQAIPHLLRGKDLLGVAQTGTGKTAAFALPVLQRLDDQASPARPKRPRALILAPTRELALQIHEEFAAFGRYTQLRHAFIIGWILMSPPTATMMMAASVASGRWCKSGVNQSSVATTRARS